MQPFSGVVTDKLGNAVKGASVLVLTAAGAVAVIYDAAEAPTANPLTTDDFGRFNFRAPNARYSVRTLGAGIVTPPDLSIQLNDPDYLMAAADWLESCVLSGGLPAVSATLIASTSAVVGYVGGRRVAVGETSKTYTASRDTYVDLAGTGLYTYVENTSGAATPPITANSMRVAKVVTDATAVVGVTDLRPLTRAIKRVLHAQAVLDFGSITAQATAELTIALSGAVVGAPCKIGLATAPPAGIVFAPPFVATAGVVTVRAANVTAAAIDPPAITVEVEASVY